MKQILTAGAMLLALASCAPKVTTDKYPEDVKKDGLVTIIEDNNITLPLRDSRAVMKFTATWCGPCKRYKPVFQELADYNPNISFYSVDIDENPNIKKKYEIPGVPTTVFLKDGQEVKRIVGYSDGKKRELIEEAVYDHSE